MGYIGKWLKAGVLEGESLSYAEKGTPQGGVVSSMISSMFLHHVAGWDCTLPAETCKLGLSLDIGTVAHARRYAANREIVSGCAGNDSTGTSFLATSCLHSRV